MDIEISKENINFKLLEKFFNSNDFINIVAKYVDEKDLYYSTKSVVSVLINLSTSYVEAFKDLDFASLDNLSKFLNNLKDIKFDTLAVDSFTIEEKFKIWLKEFGKSAEEIKKILEDFECKNIFKYHAFNSCFEESIKEWGINPSYKDQEAENYKEMVSKIFESHDNPNYITFLKNDKYSVSFALSARDAYSYSTGSPEWFARVCGYEAWRMRDFKSAKSKVISDCNYWGLTKEEQNKVLKFFYKYWNKYKEGKPELAIIPIPEEEKEEYSNYKYFGYDERSDDSISLKDATFIKLPEYNKILSKVKSKLDSFEQ